jgi:hypothetical protein
VSRPASFQAAHDGAILYEDTKEILQNFFACVMSRIFLAKAVNKSLYFVHSASTYGEITSAGLRSLMSRLEFRDDDSFFDLGSGVGRAVLQVHLEHSNTRCVYVCICVYKPAHAFL